MQILVAVCTSWKWSEPSIMSLFFRPSGCVTEDVSSAFLCPLFQYVTHWTPLCLSDVQRSSLNAFLMMCKIFSNRALKNIMVDPWNYNVAKRTVQIPPSAGLEWPRGCHVLLSCRKFDPHILVMQYRSNRLKPGQILSTSDTENCFRELCAAFSKAGKSSSRSSHAMRDFYKRLFSPFLHTEGKSKTSINLFFSFPCMTGREESWIIA